MDNKKTRFKIGDKLKINIDFYVYNAEKIGLNIANKKLKEITNFAGIVNDIQIIDDAIIYTFENGRRFNQALLMEA